jgi:hypothetical protein
MEIKNAVVDLTLVTDRKEIHDDTPIFRQLYNALTAWAASSDMKEISFVRDGGDPLLYAWRAERNDGRVLDSTMLFDSDEDDNPDLTISLPASWPLSVIEEGGPTRSLLIGIRAACGLVSFEVTFL